MFIHEIDILKNWIHFIILLEFFVIHKTIFDKVFLRTIKFKRVFNYSNVLNFIMGFNILHKKAHMCLYF